MKSQTNQFLTKKYTTLCKCLTAHCLNGKKQSFINQYFVKVTEIIFIVIFLTNCS